MSTLPRRIRVVGSLVFAVLLFAAGGVMAVLGLARGDRHPSHWFFVLVLLAVGTATLLLPWLVERQRDR